MAEPLKKTPLKILIVEDELAMLKLLVITLTDEGFEVVTAMDGVQGLKNAEVHHPDLILLDIVLPEMDGITMMKKLRAESEWGKKVPIIILTNLNADDTIMKAVTENEPSYYLVKTNWKPDDVVRKVRERLGTAD